ncbi:choice-of-anchor D domain-containing protein [Adhaeribacter swui]|uniref:Choice-of-anchor D domain-containing protein n=1 Tax=Adhaeribacter swui TaxID=2086471 RepID=A0A7G7G2U2_9BACT|nr:malectin domain-containing carbohydrate-binding protein [Adhaeribacter swui]QNF31476.1 choice-of-anchor D domain-containing protein [Adhaeribacter swui]
MKMNYTTELFAHFNKLKPLLVFIVFLLIGNINLQAKIVVADPPCNPYSTLPCNQLSVALPFSLTFNNSVVNSITDKNGIGTGFTMVDTYTGSRLTADGSVSNANVPGYVPANLSVSSGTLKIVTNKGIASTNSNNQLNTLGVRVDSRSKLQLDVNIINPYVGSQYEQGGLWFGLSDKTFIKIVVNGSKIEMRKELNDVSVTSDQRITGTINNLNTQTVRLRLVIDPVTNTAEGFYSLDGTNYSNVGATYTTKTLGISGMGLTNSTAYAGIFATHRNANAPVTYTFDNFNVKSFNIPNPLNSNAYMVLENPDKLPANDQLTFSIIQIPWRRTDPVITPYNENHDRIKLKISNKGTGDLIINNLTLTNTAAWKIETFNGSAYNASTVLPLKLAKGASAEVGIQFIAKSAGTRVAIVNGSLIISSNDDIAPNKEVVLRGLWQYKGEGKNEPYAREIIQAFGYKTNTGYTQHDGAIDGKTIVPNSDEVAADYFMQADLSQPVVVSQLAAYHGCCRQVEDIFWYDKQAGTKTRLFYHDALDGQSLLPRIANKTTTASGTFKSSKPFGFLVQDSYSDRNKNFEKRIGMRFWKAIDSEGKVIPNTYIVGTDYLGTEYTNYDYQDNVYLISNVRLENEPASVPALVSAPSALSFGTLQTGVTKTVAVKLTNQSSSSAQISAVEVVGPNLNEFTAVLPATTLAANASINVNVNFSPSTRGLKNAALIVHYSTGHTPLRIPLYGIANDASFALNIAKRIKGAADANVTINGTTWEADKAYRQGSIMLDKQVVAGPIAGTDEDVLYQTYLSAASNLAETRYQVPLANGTYWVRMHFVENYFNGPVGTRVFSTTIENELRLSGFDIFREVGYRAALVKDFEVVVKDGGLSIKFNPTANRVALAATEIYKVSAATVTAIANETLNTGTENIAAAVTVYPNPTETGNLVQIELSGFAPNQKVDIALQDVMGKQILNNQVTTNATGTGQMQFSDTQRLAAGLYLINAQGTDRKAQTKLLIK